VAEGRVFEHSDDCGKESRRDGERTVKGRKYAKFDRSSFNWPPLCCSSYRLGLLSANFGDDLGH
jgi:hypothetical protein